jgi:DNA-binding response OmpR family regulator
MNERILIVEDEEKLARFIELELNYEGYQTSKAPDGRTGLALALSGEFDLVALDIMLPDLNGFEVLRRIRQNSKVPVIMLTARDELTDKVAGLDGGANDYITKPFAIEELLARIRMVLRSSGAREEPASPLLVSGSLSLNPESREAQVGGRPVDLTKREFDLLETLLRNKGRVLGREQLLDSVWGYDFPGETNAVDVYIRYLRAKIEDPFGEKFIQTVRGVGYIIRD